MEDFLEYLTMSVSLCSQLLLGTWKDGFHVTRSDVELLQIAGFKPIFYAFTKYE